MKNFIWILFFPLFALVFFTSCGYQFEGGGYIKDNVTRVAVITLENKSSETGADIIFTNALIQEIIQKTDTKVVDESHAIAVLKGTLNAITFETLSRSTTESVVERRVTASIDLKLMDKEGEVIWRVKDFTSHEEYIVSENVMIDETNTRQAVEKIAIRSAEKAISKLRINF